MTLGACGVGSTRAIWIHYLDNSNESKSHSGQGLSTLTHASREIEAPTEKPIQLKKLLTVPRKVTKGINLLQ